MYCVLDVSTLDTFSSGAKQRFVNIYRELIKHNKKKKFLIIYTTFDDIVKIFNFPNVKFLKNPISQDSYFKKILSVIYIFLYLKLKFSKLNSIEYFTLPFLSISPTKNVLTIHDLRRIYFSNNLISRWSFIVFFNFFIKQVQALLVVSEAMKKEISKNFKKIKIHVVYNCVDENLFKKIPKKTINLVKKKCKINRDFILTVGHLEKRKNFINLIKSISILKNNNRDILLVIIGQHSDEVKNIKSLIKKLNLNSNVKIFSNLNNLEVRCLYSAASLFVFPSKYEGFGIPILEAMSSNLPMVLSNLEVFREITENKYYYFDQFDPLSIANNIKYVIQNKSIQRKMINYGKKRINYFKLENQKKNLIKFYNSIL